MCETCTLAVFGLMKSAVPISRFVFPSASRRRTSSSRAVSPNGSSGAGGRLGSRPRREIDAGPARELLDLLAQRPRAEPGGERVAAGDSASATRVRAAPAASAASASRRRAYAARKGRWLPLAARRIRRPSRRRRPRRRRVPPRARRAPRAAPPPPAARPASTVRRALSARVCDEQPLRPVDGLLLARRSSRPRAPARRAPPPPRARARSRAARRPGSRAPARPESRGSRARPPARPRARATGRRRLAADCYISAPARRRARGALDVCLGRVEVAAPRLELARFGHDDAARDADARGLRDLGQDALPPRPTGRVDRVARLPRRRAGERSPRSWSWSRSHPSRVRPPPPPTGPPRRGAGRG